MLRYVDFIYPGWDDGMDKCIRTTRPFESIHAHLTNRGWKVEHSNTQSVEYKKPTRKYRILVQLT